MAVCVLSTLVLIPAALAFVSGKFTDKHFVIDYGEGYGVGYASVAVLAGLICVYNLLRWRGRAMRLEGADRPPLLLLSKSQQQHRIKISNREAIPSCASRAIHRLGSLVALLLAAFTLIPGVATIWIWPRWSVSLSPGDIEKLRCKAGLTRPRLLYMSLVVGALSSILPGPFALVHLHWSSQVDAAITRTLLSNYHEVSFKRVFRCSDLNTSWCIFLILLSFSSIATHPRRAAFSASVWQGSFT